MHVCVCLVKCVKPVDLAFMRAAGFEQGDACSDTHYCFSFLQSGHFQYRGVSHALKSIWFAEGAKGMPPLILNFS